MNPHNLLVIDWDTFFNNPMDGGDVKRADLRLYDWSHGESPFFQEMVWPNRAAGFIIAGLPLPDLTGEQLGFWQRFSFAPRARLFYADSNALAVSRKIVTQRTRFASVWLYDAHHDAYGHTDNPRQKVGELIRRGLWSCEDWMVLYSVIGASLHLRYPRWKVGAFDERGPIVPMDRAFDDGSSPDVVFDRVFVCRSSAWVPPWLNIDQQFQDFVQAAPIKQRLELQSVAPRQFSMQAAQADAAMTRAWHAERARASA